MINIFLASQVRCAALPVLRLHWRDDPTRTADYNPWRRLVRVFSPIRFLGHLQRAISELNFAIPAMAPNTALSNDGYLSLLYANSGGLAVLIWTHNVPRASENVSRPYTISEALPYNAPLRAMQESFIQRFLDFQSRSMLPRWQHRKCCMYIYVYMDS